MKQYKITTENLLHDDPTDCYLSPDDPIHSLKMASQLGGLGSMQRLAEYRAKQVNPIVGSNNHQIARENNIQPGTPEWFELYFKNNINR